MRRLGLHHFAHLRAVAEGIDVQEAAQRYLGIDHGHQSRTAHQQAVDSVRAISRRRGDRAWRLIGITIRLPGGAGNKPSLEDFVAERGLDGWSESEVQEMYAEAYPTDLKTARRQRLRERQLQLIRDLESVAAVRPAESDMVDGWFDQVTADKLIAAGMLTLGDLNSRVSAGGRWWTSLPGVGVTKARRIESHLRTLLPRQDVILPLYTLASVESFSRELVAQGQGSGSLLKAQTDLEAVQAWIDAKKGSTATETVYQRESGRLLVWLKYERQGRLLKDLTVEDATDFAEFLREIPDRYISRRRAAPGQPGWAPFRGQLSVKSRRQSLVIVSGMADWLVRAQYLRANPFALINKRTGDDKSAPMLEVKALSEGMMAIVLAHIELAEPSPSRTRALFLFRFLEATGLRSAEIVAGTVGDLMTLPEGLGLHVHGKGAKNRMVPVNAQAREALDDYLLARGLGGIESAPAEAPLLASVNDPMEPIGYQALYQHVRSWIRRVVAAAALDLPAHERSRLARASVHWLRHTFGTRALARGAGADAVQVTMGHSSPTMTARYTRASAQRQFDEMAKAFG